jgi:hypothetical protein
MGDRSSRFSGNREVVVYSIIEWYAGGCAVQVTCHLLYP